jgi:C_GCAxxG_C_C family probable redox protein
MTRVEEAEKLFRDNANCAQSVLVAFCPVTGLDESMASRITSGFGAGMARLQETCGAVTGSYMVLGLEMAKRANGREAVRDKTYGAMRKFEKLFRERHGTTNCGKLLGCDLNTHEGQAAYKDHGLKDAVCLDCIKYAVGIVETLIAD